MYILFFREKYHDRKDPIKEKLTQFLKSLLQLLYPLHKAPINIFLGMEYTITVI